MKFHAFLISALLTLLVVPCASAEPLNDMPMYGGYTKSPEMKAADEKFINSIVQAYGSREKGAQEAVKRGWKAEQAGDFSTAMKRFNQAWLLDDKNAEVYWGFGVVLLKRNEEKQGAALLEKASSLIPDNARLMADLAHAYSLLGRDYLNKENKTSDVFLHKSEDLFSKAERIDPSYGLLYAYWASARYYHRDFRGAWEKIHRARETGAGAELTPAFLEALDKRMHDPLQN